MEAIKKIVDTTKRTWKGSLVGAIAGYYAAKKTTGTSNKWYLAGAVVAGAVAGSIVEDKIMSKTPKVTEKKVGGVEK